MSDTIEVNGITFTKEKPTKAGYYLYATVSPNRTWVRPITVEPEYENTTELGCCHYQWHPVSELNYYWHRLVSEQEVAAALARIKRLEAELSTIKAHNARLIDSSIAAWSRVDEKE